MNGEDFTIELRVFASAGLRREHIVDMLTKSLELETDDGPVYVYSRQSKIARETLMEVTGTRKDLARQPVLSPALIAQLRQVLPIPYNVEDCKYDDASETMYCYEHSTIHRG